MPRSTATSGSSRATMARSSFRDGPWAGPGSQEHRLKDPFSEARVHRFRARGQSPRPGMTRRMMGAGGLFRAGGFDSLAPRQIRGEPGMAIIVGTGDFKYRIVEDWAKLPDGGSFKEVGAVGVDAKG